MPKYDVTLSRRYFIEAKDAKEAEKMAYDLLATTPLELEEKMDGAEVIEITTSCEGLIPDNVLFAERLEPYWGK